MPDPTVINVRQDGDQFIAEVPDLNTTVTGATLDEAELNAERAIVAAQIAAKSSKQPRNRKQPAHKGQVKAS